MSNDNISELPRGLIGRHGNPTGKSTRLPSIRTPRDLTLGGIPKKVFMPNIPIRKERNQNSTTGITPATVKVTESKGRNFDQNSRGRGRGRMQPNVVQSHSIFEEGPSQSCPKPSSTIDRVSSTSSSSHTPRARHNKEESKQLLDEILRDDFIDDGGNSEDTYNPMPPVYLPLSTPKNHIKHEIKTELKKEVSSEIKMEVEEPIVAATKLSNCSQLFTKTSKLGDRGETVLVQLPDFLPGRPLLDQTTESETSPSEKSAVLLNQLRDFSEGRIGKLCVRRSGKTELILGDAHFDVNLGTSTGFLQELVSIRVNEASQSGQLYLLSNVQDKLICIPNLDSLLDYL